MKQAFFHLSTTLASVCAAAVLTFAAPPARAQNAGPLSEVLVVHDAVVLRAAPKASAPQQALLWQGERLEVRGEKLGYLQVWDHQRERGGFVSADLVRRLGTSEADVPALLAVLRFVKGSPGSEGLTFGYGAAWLQAASGPQVASAEGAEVVDAIAQAAVRLAERASGVRSTGSAQAANLAQLDAAKRYGLRFSSVEDSQGMRVCYDGDLFHRLLALPGATGEQRARSVLALSSDTCADADGGVLAKAQRLEGVAAMLDGASEDSLPPILKNRLHLKRASVWSTVAFDRARNAGKGNATQAASRSLEELARVQPDALPEDLVAEWNNAVMSVNASRWAALPAVPSSDVSHGFRTVASRGSSPGETCLVLQSVAGTAGPKGLTGDGPALGRRCTHGLAWIASFSVNPERTVAVLAVQPMAGWQELWLWQKQGDAWEVRVLPPSSASPGLGYAEWAGWVPGGRQMLVARESRAEGRYQRSYEILDLSTLATVRQANDPKLLGAFKRWQAPSWVQNSVSLR